MQDAKKTRELLLLLLIVRINHVFPNMFLTHLQLRGEQRSFQFLLMGKNGWIMSLGLRQPHYYKDKIVGKPV